MQKLFVENCKHQRHNLRGYIIRHNILPYKCAICGITEWNGKTLSLELDHINGVNNDNRLENLRFLCPNCHSHDLNHYSRVIGYFSHIEKWSKARREFDFPRRKFLNPKDIKTELGE